jgi:Fe-S-cluster containining protein
MVIKTNGHQLETQEILEGFLYSYRQLDTNALKVYEASAHLYSLIELLVAKGIIGVEELDQRKKAVEKRLQDSFKEAGIGVRVQRSEVDKYSLPEEVKIDCEKRQHLCRAACCTLTYALSLQDIDEGIRWCLGKPFMNARGADGYCVHLQRDILKCSIYEHRPVVCRGYDCRNDRRIWLDFEKMIVNPDLFGRGSPPQTGEVSTEQPGS